MYIEQELEENPRPFQEQNLFQLLQNPCQLLMSRPVQLMYLKAPQTILIESLLMCQFVNLMNQLLSLMYPLEAKLRSHLLKLISLTEYHRFRELESPRA